MAYGRDPNNTEEREDILNNEEFDEMLDICFKRIDNVLRSKAQEYASDHDRLHNFHKAAGLTGGTPKQACWGFNVKHLVSIADMVESDEEFPLKVWDEKLFDAINYLLLLRALVIDDIPDAVFDDLPGVDFETNLPSN